MISSLEDLGLAEEADYPWRLPRIGHLQLVFEGVQPGRSKQLWLQEELAKSA